MTQKYSPPLQSALFPLYIYYLDHQIFYSKMTLCAHISIKYHPLPPLTLRGVNKNSAERNFCLSGKSRASRLCSKTSILLPRKTRTKLGYALFFFVAFLAFFFFAAILVRFFSFSKYLR